MPDSRSLLRGRRVAQTDAATHANEPEARRAESAGANPACAVGASRVTTPVTARFVQAGSAIELKDTAKAIKFYREIAEDPEAPAVMRDLARLRDALEGP